MVKRLMLLSCLVVVLAFGQEKKSPVWLGAFVGKGPEFFDPFSTSTIYLGFDMYSCTLDVLDCVEKFVEGMRKKGVKECGPGTIAYGVANLRVSQGNVITYISGIRIYKHLTTVYGDLFCVLKTKLNKK